MSRITACLAAAQKLKEMKASRTDNKPKLKACCGEVKGTGLTGDDRCSRSKIA